MAYDGFTNIRISDKENKYHGVQGVLISDLDNKKEEIPDDMVEVRLDQVYGETKLFKIEKVEYYDTEEKKWKELSKK